MGDFPAHSTTVPLLAHPIWGSPAALLPLGMGYLGCAPLPAWKFDLWGLTVGCPCLGSGQIMGAGVGSLLFAALLGPPRLLGGFWCWPLCRLFPRVGTWPARTCCLGILHILGSLVAAGTAQCGPSLYANFQLNSLPNSQKNS